MSDKPEGPGWWIASDGKWYPPELHPSFKDGSGAEPAAVRSAPSRHPPSRQRPRQRPSQQRRPPRGRPPARYPSDGSQVRSPSSTGNPSDGRARVTR